jgi:aminopeptidase N
VRRYIAAHAYGNTVTVDFWSALEAASSTPVVAIARDFTEQPGVPLMTVDRMDCRNGRTVVTLHQDRFAVDESAAEKLHWRVPVVVAVLGGGEARAVVDGAAEIAVQGCGTVKVNAGNAAYFRTRYPAEAFERLDAAFARLAPADQLGLLYDSRALGAAGLEPMADYLGLAADVDADANPVVLLQIARAYAELARLYRGEPGADRFASYARERLNEYFARVGWNERPGEPPNVAVLRGALIETLAALGDADVRTTAARRFAAAEKDAASLPGGIRRAVTRAVAMQADAAAWGKLRSLALAAPSALEQRFYLDALTYVQDDELAARTLDFLVGPDVPKQLAPRLMLTVAREHPDLVWRFTVDRYAEIAARIDALQRYTLIPRLAASSAKLERARELERLFGERMPDAPRAGLERAIDEIEANADVRTKRLREIDAWLAAR